MTSTTKTAFTTLATALLLLVLCLVRFVVLIALASLLYAVWSVLAAAMVIVRTVVTRPALVAAVLGLFVLLMVLLRFSAYANPPPGMVLDPAIHKWFEEQKIPDGSGKSCCAYADGHVLEEDQWRISKDQEYEVATPEGWLVFPNTGFNHPGNTVLGTNGNPTGHPVAWWDYLGGTPRPRCLALGAVT